MASSVVRIGSWDYLRWRHITPIVNSNGEIAAAKALVYAGDPEELLLHHTGSIHISKRKDLLIISRASIFCYLSYYWTKRLITMYVNFIYSE
jgi:hypothetical protein